MYSLILSGSMILEMGRLETYPDEILLLVKGSYDTDNELQIFRVSTIDGSLKWA